MKTNPIHTESVESTTVDRVPSPVDVIDTYLGFEIRCIGGWFVAGPRDWRGEAMGARSKPILRRKIWRWWHQVQP